LKRGPLKEVSSSPSNSKTEWQLITGIEKVRMQAVSIVRQLITCVLCLALFKPLVLVMLELAVDSGFSSINKCPPRESGGGGGR